MIDFVRTKVSGAKFRYQEDGYNLDLTYITPRVIAMSLPGEGVHKVYRNSIDSVSRFLREKHSQHFRVMNLSGLRYDYDKFEGEVFEFAWPDHYPPPIDVLFRACQNMHFWLCQDVENVIVVNCRAGKGRTGTLICCYLLYCQRIHDTRSALKYYKFKRFKKGGGVTQPSQVRYIEYFLQIIAGGIKLPIFVQLNKIELKTAPHINNHSCRPVFNVYENNVLKYTSKKGSKEVILSDSWEDEEVHELDTVETQLYLYGDVDCTLTHLGMFKAKKICRFTFNTAFIPSDYELRLKKSELDPDSFAKSKKVADNFEIVLKFNRFCRCDREMTLNERCADCKIRLTQDMIENWIMINESVHERIGMNPKILLFGNPENDDVDEILSMEIEEDALSSDGSVE
jgi:phosphatidylinositol-3,4,5-trisphosphate 3-phosphatase and dual-specificity protein phosphatase PTEN